MRSRDHKDILAGGLLVAVGLWAGIYAWQSYALGTVTHMGPGMLPTVLGFSLAGIGMLILVPAFFRAGAPLLRPDYRQFVAVLGGLLAFALTVDGLGLVPAIFLMTMVAVLADDRLGIVGTLALAAGLSIIAVLIFRVGLRIPLDAFKWPF